MNYYESVKEQNPKLAVIGMGYVGMPLALAFDKKMPVIGFDTDIDKINLYLQGEDPTGEAGSAAILQSQVEFTNDERRLAEAAIFIVTVPTPVNEDETPDLAYLINASRTVGHYLSAGALVIYESTVYPGVTESVCIPVLEEASALKCGTDFKVGYSPERINPGDLEHTLLNTNKLVSGVDAASLEQATLLYELIIEAKVHKASSIKVAEAAKIVENCQRDINIAFVNELSLLFDRINIDTLEVLEAAGSKWNFLPFRPGLVGGHCIGVDPYYLIHDAKKAGYHLSLLARGRQINNSMAEFITDKTIKLLVQSSKLPQHANIYILGITFKENCPDIRNSKVLDIYRNLLSYGISAKVADPVADELTAHQLYGDSLVSLEDVTEADCIILAVAHDEFFRYSDANIGQLFKQQSNNDERVIIDIKSLCNKKNLTKLGYRYWRL